METKSRARRKQNRKARRLNPVTAVSLPEVEAAIAMLREPVVRARNAAINLHTSGEDRRRSLIEIGAAAAAATAECLKIDGGALGQMDTTIVGVAVAAVSS